MSLDDFPFIEFADQYPDKNELVRALYYYFNDLDVYKDFEQAIVVYINTKVIPSISFNVVAAFTRMESIMSWDWTDDSRGMMWCSEKQDFKLANYK